MKHKDAIANRGQEQRLNCTLPDNDDDGSVSVHSTPGEERKVEVTNGGLGASESSQVLAGSPANRPRRSVALYNGVKPEKRNSVDRRPVSSPRRRRRSSKRESSEALLDHDVDLKIKELKVKKLERTIEFYENFGTLVNVVQAYVARALGPPGLQLSNLVASDQSSSIIKHDRSTAVTGDKSAPPIGDGDRSTVTGQTVVNGEVTAIE